VKLREKAALVNWYLDFAQRKDLEKITDKKELQKLSDEVLSRFFHSPDSSRVVTLSENLADVIEGFGIPSDPPYDPGYLQKLSDVLWRFFAFYILPGRPHEEKKISGIGFPFYPFTAFEVSPKIEMRDGQWHYVESWSMRPPQMAFLTIMQLLDGCPADSFRKCDDPKCQKWFFNPTKKERHYCSKACLWRHKSEINRQKDDYKIRQRIRMKFTYVAGSGKTEDCIRKTMIKYMKNLDLSQNEIDQWLNWWVQKRASQKKEN